MKFEKNPTWKHFDTATINVTSSEGSMKNKKQWQTNLFLIPLRHGLPPTSCSNKDGRKIMKSMPHSTHTKRN